MHIKKSNVYIKKSNVNIRKRLFAYLPPRIRGAVVNERNAVRRRVRFINSEEPTTEERRTDRAVGSASGGGVIRQRQDGTTYVDKTVNVVEARREARKLGSSGTAQRIFYNREGDVIGVQDTSRSISRAPTTSERLALGRKVRPQTSTPQPTRTERTRQFISDFPTRGEFLEKEQQRFFEKRFNSLSASEVRTRALAGDSQIYGESTAQGERFYFNPSEAERKTALFEARGAFFALPPRERLRLSAGSAALGVSDLFVGTVSNFGVQTNRGRARTGSIYESYQNKPRDIISNTFAFSSGVALGNIGSAYRPSRTLLGPTRSSTGEIETAIVRDLGRTPSRTFIIQSSRDSIAVNQRLTPFARQTTISASRTFGPKQERFITGGVSEINIPNTRIGTQKNSFVGLGRTTTTPVSETTSGFNTRALIFSSNDKIKVKGIGFSRTIDERRSVGIYGSKSTATTLNRDFGTFRAYNLPSSSTEGGGSSIFGKGKGGVSRKSMSGGQSSIQVSSTAEKSFIGQITKNIQTNKPSSIGPFSSMSGGQSLRINQRTKQKTTMRTEQVPLSSTLTLQTQRTPMRTLLAAPPIQIPKTRTRTRTGLISGSFSGLSLSQPQRQLYASAPFSPIRPSFIQPRTTYTPRGFPPFLPRINFDGGLYLGKSRNIASRRYTTYTPSYSALVFGIRGRYRKGRLARSGFDFRPLNGGFGR